MRRLARWAGLCAGGLFALLLLAALGLALVPAPKLTFPIAQGGASALPCVESPEIRCLPMRDGLRLAVRHVPVFRSANREPGSVILFLHGVLASGAEPAIERLAQGLQSAAGAEVYRLDLRDHGRSASRPDPGHLADLDHIGQYEEDVADALAHLRREHPGRRLLLAGHSMGGGIALRYAARPELHKGAEVDGYLLFAPLLGDGSPTARKAPTPGAKTEGHSIVKVAVPRLLGLALLNLVHIRGLNGLGTLYFDLPADLPVRAYSFRAMASMAPDDYRAALRADAKPLLAIAGEQDEAFQAEAYPAVIALHPQGKTVLISGATHDGVLADPRSVEAVGEWLRGEGWAPNPS